MPRRERELVMGRWWRRAAGTADDFDKKVRESRGADKRIRRQAREEQEMERRSAAPSIGVEG